MYQKWFASFMIKISWWTIALLLDKLNQAESNQNIYE